MHKRPAVFFGNKVFDFLVILIKPVLVPFRFKTQHCLSSGEDGRFQQVTMCFDVMLFRSGVEVPKEDEFVFFWGWLTRCYLGLHRRLL